MTEDSPERRAVEQAAEAIEETGEAVEAADEAADEAAEAADAANDAEAQARDAHAAAKEAGRAVMETVDPDDPLLDTAIRQLEAGVTDERPFGEPGEPVAPRSPFRIAFTAALGVLTALLLAYAVTRITGILVLIVIAGFLAIGLNPAVEWLQRRGLARGVAVAVVIGTVLLFVGGFVAAAVPPVARQAGELREKVPEYLEAARENRTYRQLDDQFAITPKITELARTNTTKVATNVVDLARALLGGIFKLITVLILTLYFLSAYPAMKRGAYRLVPRSRRARVGLLADEILARVGGYVLGNIATSAVAGVCSFVFLVAIDVPYPFALAMLVAILDLIPLVGATIAAVVCTAVAFFVSARTGLIAGAFFLAYQQFENYVLVPRVMKRTVDVSPLATVVAALVGGTLLGVVGALLAIPVAAAIQLIGTEVLIPRQDSA